VQIFPKAPKYFTKTFFVVVVVVVVVIGETKLFTFCSQK